MRWDGLFGDLERRFDAGLLAEADAMAQDEARARHAGRGLRDRLLGAGLVAVVATRGGEVLRLRVDAVGADWIAGAAAEGGASAIVPLPAIAWMQTRVVEAAPPESRERAGLAVVLRELARRRAGVELVLAGGRVTGTIDRVAADHLDLAVHAAGQPRRRDSVAGERLVPLAAVDVVRWRE